MEILKSHGTLFLAPIRWSTFTLKYLRINNNEKGLLRISKLQRQSPNIRIDTDGTLGFLWTELKPFDNHFKWIFSLLVHLYPQQARICLDALWQHWNVSTLHQGALSLATFHFFCPLLPFSLLYPPVNVQFNGDPQSTHRWPAASFRKEEW